MLLLTSHIKDGSCYYGTAIITSNRFNAKLWIGQIWEGKFVRFACI